MTQTEKAPLGLDEFEGSLWWSGLRSKDITGELPSSMFGEWLSRYDSLEACHTTIAAYMANGWIPARYHIVGPPKPQTLEKSLDSAKKHGYAGVRVWGASGQVIMEVPVEVE